MTNSARVAQIEFAVETAADPAIAWVSISHPARIAEWLTEASPLGPVGSPYALGFGEGRVVSGLVFKVEPGVGFTHTWRWDGADETETTRVAWSVAAAPGGSRISLVHDGWDEAGLDADTRDDHAGYWAGNLEDLRDVLAS